MGGSLLLRANFQNGSLAIRNTNCNLCGQISGRWNFGKVIEIGFGVEMSQLFPDVGKIGKLTKTARKTQRRPKTRSRGANLRARNLGCAKHTVNLVHGNGAPGRGEIFFFYAPGGGCTSSPRTVMPTSGCLCQVPFPVYRAELSREFEISQFLELVLFRLFKL